MSVLSAAFVSLLGLVILATIIAERGIKAVGLAPHKVKFPGPKALPFFGNFLELRSGHARAFISWAEKFGPIMRIVVGDREAVVLNTYGAVQKTLITNGQAFAGRPELRMYHGVFATATDHEAPPTLGTTSWSDKVLTYRKHLGLQTAGHKLKRYNHYVSRRLFRMVRLLADDAKKGPRDLGHTLWTTTIGFSADMTFGTHIDDKLARTMSYAEIDIHREPRTIGQPFHIAVPILDRTQRALRPVRFLFDALGFTFFDDIDSAENRAKALRKTELEYSIRLLQESKARIQAGDLTPSQLGDVVRMFGETYTTYDEYKVATSLVGSGMGIGTITLWLMSMLAARPDIQKKARDAIKAEYGDENPDPLDTDRVEYIQALGLEASRYFATTRLGFPRETTEDVTLEGVHIPEGTMVMHNTYLVNRDPARYDYVNEFMPERWMDGHYGRVSEKGERVGLPHLTNGAGRRYCLGVPYVHKMMYGAIILFLHFFELERGPLDEEGLKEVFPDYRAAAQSSPAVDPIFDQISLCASQALPKATGVRLIPRNPEQLARWIDEDHASMDQFERADETIGLVA
jgi:hypothetical protein